MTPFRWVLLCILFTLYLLLGGSIFMLIEQHHEIHQKEELHVLRQDIQEILFRLDRNFYNNWTSPDVLDALTQAKEGVINRISAVCGIENLLDTSAQSSEPASLKWNYYNSVFFAFTVVTTIGYGHLSPSTSLSKSLMMVYALIGIPLNGILLSGVGDYFSNKIVKVHQKSKDKQYRGKSLTLVFEIIFYLIPGIVVFIIIPAGIFVLIENWTFLDSVYFAFVSLTTIGFGDYVAGMGDGHNFWLWLYKAFIIIWITFGLGYLIMILGFIAKGMKSKKVRGVLEKRLVGIRNTKEKLSKDIDYMRRIVNELYMMKIKPVYDVNGVQTEEEDKDDLHVITHNGILKSRRPSCVHFDRRCSSLPHLPIRVEDECDSGNASASTLVYTPTLTDLRNGEGGAKRNFKRAKRLVRRLSESDAPYVDRDEAFLDLRSGSISPEELLVTIVNALSGNMKNVMDAVDELNKYEQQVEDETIYGGSESPEESDPDDRSTKCDVESSTESFHKPQASGPLSPWELRAVSESDEEILLDENAKASKGDQLQTIVVHKSGDDGDQGQSFLEKVSIAIRKISGAKTPPETPSRKISRHESDKKRKISRMESAERSPGILHKQFHPPQTSPFIGRPLTRHPSSITTPETDRRHSHYAKHTRAPNSDISRKISQESRVSRLSNTSYQNIDELMNSVRAGRKTTPAHYHPSSPVPPLLSEDDVDTNPNFHDSHQSGRVSLETSTSSLAHFLKALDTVQDRLQKSSVCSEASYSGSYHLSDNYDATDLSNSFAPSTAAKAIRGIRSVAPSRSVFDRKRKNGVFEPGFSYTNFGYSPEDEEEDVTVVDAMGRVVTRRRLPEDDFVDTTSTVNLTDSFTTSKKRAPPPPKI